MSSGSGLKGSLITTFVIGLLGILIRYLFGGDDNRGQIHDSFIDILKMFWWITRYVLFPILIIGVIGIFIDNHKKP